MNKPKTYWNHRVVAEYHYNKKPALRCWTFTIREVHYKNDKPTSWTAHGLYPQGSDKVGDLFEEMEMMSKEVYAPLLIIQGNKLVEYPKKIITNITPKHLKKYETKSNTTN